MANFQIVYSKTFDSELEKLSQIDQQRVMEKIILLEEYPMYPSLRTKKLRGGHGHFASSVNMDIRLIWRFEGDKIIVMLDVGHHDVLKKY